MKEIWEIYVRLKRKIRKLLMNCYKLVVSPLLRIVMIEKLGKSERNIVYSLGKAYSHFHQSCNLPSVESLLTLCTSKFLRNNICKL